MSTSGTDSDVVGGINNLDSDLGTRTSLTTTADQNLVVAINEIDAELGTITAGAMGTTASTVSAAIAELDTEADSDRTNLGANVKAHMLANGVSAQVTATANNSTDETTFITFTDGATGAQGIETDTGLTYTQSKLLVKEANKQGGFVFWNHPMWGSQANDGVSRLTEMHKQMIAKDLIHGIEVVNTEEYSEEALQIALDNNLAIIGTSDVHELSLIHI